MLALPVDGDLFPHHIQQAWNGHLSATDQRTGSRRRQDTRDQHLTFFHLTTVLGDPAREVVIDAEATLDQSPRSAVPDQPAFRFLTGEQSEPRHDHRLARTRFASHRSEARPKIDGRIVDDAQPGDPQFSEH